MNCSHSLRIPFNNLKNFRMCLKFYHCGLKLFLQCFLRFFLLFFILFFVNTVWFAKNFIYNFSDRSHKHCRECKCYQYKPHCPAAKTFCLSEQLNGSI